jgi:phospholipid/cholesterol/gamma-HCH transport system substrate-binding protein
MRRLGAVAAGVVTVLVVSGCGFTGVSSLPLPGGVSGPDTYRVTVVLDDATDLVTKETCRSGDVTVGTVDSVTLGPDLKAHVVCVIKNSVRLPGNTVATLESTSLLGERFVALGPPAGQQPAGTLRPDTVLRDSGARIDPDTEQVLGALSAVLNGGDLPKIAIINQQLNDALTGHEADIRSLLDQLTTVTGDLDAHSTDITNALNALNKLTGTLAAQRDVVGQAIDGIPAGLKVLNDQRPQLIALLQHLQQLSATAIPLINASEQNTVADLALLHPVLNSLATNGSQIATALRTVLTFPFPNNATAAVKGDYAGIYATLNLSLDTVTTLLAQELAAVPTIGASPATPAGAVAGLPSLPGLLSPTTPVVATPPSLNLSGLLGLLTGGTP